LAGLSYNFLKDGKLSLGILEKRSIFLAGFTGRLVDIAFGHFQLGNFTKQSYELRKVLQRQEVKDMKLSLGILEKRSNFLAGFTGRLVDTAFGHFQLGNFTKQS
jgi:hypothetical protein